MNERQAIMGTPNTSETSSRNCLRPDALIQYPGTGGGELQHFVGLNRENFKKTDFSAYLKAASKSNNFTELMKHIQELVKIYSINESRMELLTDVLAKLTDESEEFIDHAGENLPVDMFKGALATVVLTGEQLNDLEDQVRKFASDQQMDIVKNFTDRVRQSTLDHLSDEFSRIVEIFTEGLSGQELWLQAEVIDESEMKALREKGASNDNIMLERDLYAYRDRVKKYKEKIQMLQETFDPFFKAIFQGLVRTAQQSERQSDDADSHLKANGGFWKTMRTLRRINKSLKVLFNEASEVERKYEEKISEHEKSKKR